jgi:formylglycine-generating enzyme required for sulfatase activity
MMEKTKFRRNFIFASAVSIFAVVFVPIDVSTTRAIAPQDPNATLLSEKADSVKKTSSPPKKSTAKKNRTNSPRDASSDEIRFCASIKDSTDPEDVKAYPEQYPNGKFAALAKDKLPQLETPKSSPSMNTNTAGSNTTTSGGSNTRSQRSALPRTRTNRTGIEFVLIPPGSFMMGSTNGDADQKPVHQVTINYSFYKGKYEVTQAQWQKVMENNPSNFKGDNLPVEQVSWNDAIAFIARLNAQNDGFRYRLPTEAEWEYACRAGTTGDYAGDLDAMAWYSANSGDTRLSGKWYYDKLKPNNNRTHPVGTKLPNAFGLFDMHGNVWEWCQDWYHDSYNVAPTDGSAWLSGGEQKYRVLRGGSWDYNAESVRSASRLANTPVDRNEDYGFRVLAVVRTQ